MKYLNKYEYTWGFCEEKKKKQHRFLEEEQYLPHPIMYQSSS